MQSWMTTELKKGLHLETKPPFKRLFTMNNTQQCCDRRECNEIKREEYNLKGTLEVANSMTAVFLSTTPMTLGMQPILGIALSQSFVLTMGAKDLCNREKSGVGGSPGWEGPRAAATEYQTA